jgi:integrase
MPVDDLWYLRKRGANNTRLPSRRHGQGKRWRVRYSDTDGTTRTRFFEREVDAKAFDAKQIAGVVEPDPPLRRDQPAITFKEYGERWRVSRQIGQALEYQRHLESRLRHHHYPYFGHRPIRAINVTDVLEWIAKLFAANVAQSSLKTYFDVLNTIMNAAVIDKVITDNPCRAVRLSAILRGFSRAPKWVPTVEDVAAFMEVVPPPFRAAIWLGAGAGMRLGEVLGMEAGPRCVDYAGSEIHVVQQLRFHKVQYGGFYLAPPKSGSVGDVDLDDDVAAALRNHIVDHPPVTVELADITRGTPDPGKPVTRRSVPLLFTDDQDRPIHDQAWSKLWQGWRKAAGWPQEGTFHSLRHFFATMLISANLDPTDVQKALRHSTLRITLETYVHWWPKKERRRNVVGTALRDAAANRTAIRGGCARADLY